MITKNTMTVGQLMDQLSEFDREVLVVIECAGGNMINLESWPRIYFIKSSDTEDDDLIDKRAAIMDIEAVPLKQLP